MDGEIIKSELRRRKISVSEIARRLNIPQQNLSYALSQDDVKSGTVEDIAGALGESPCIFYKGSEGAAVAVANGTNGKATAHVQADAGIAALAKQLDVKDGQIDRLLSLLEARK